MARTIKTPINRHAEFVNMLSNISDENAVRNAYRTVMGIKEWEAPFGCDGYYDGILYEFKCVKKLSGKEGAKALAQSCYYLRKFKLGGYWIDKSNKRRLTGVPVKVVVADENEAFVVMAKELEPFFTSDNYDWERTASSPDENLIADIKNAFQFTVFNVLDKNAFQSYLDALAAVGTTILNTINRDNFDSIFQVWKKEFADDLDPQRAALAYLLDLEERGSVNPNSGIVLFDFEGETKNVKLRVPAEAYNRFWSIYKRPPSAKELSAIYERKDRLVAMQNRRMDGEFFTPLPYVKLAHEYLAKAIPDAYNGEGNHHSMYDDYNWYDPCCGTGNLTYYCPTGMKGNLFMSTLNQEDVDVCKSSGQNPNAQIFKYDFLNQTDEELPLELREKLVPGSKWVFILNPPFAAGTSPNGKKSKSNVANTQETNIMRNEKLGHACQNLTAQFLHKIKYIVNKYEINAHIALFSPAIFLTGNGYSQFREKWFDIFGFQCGFCFPSFEFQGVEGSWPVLLTIYSSSIVNNNVKIDIFQKYEKEGTKEIIFSNSPLNEWVDRPSADIITPSFTNAISIATDNKIRLDRKNKQSIGYIANTANDVRNSNVSCVYSSSAGHGNGWQIIPNNFENSMIACFTKKFIVSTWLNNKDEYSVPNTSHPAYEQFKNDAIIWALFNGSNQSSSLGEVEYKGNIYDIKNEFFWLTKEEFEKIENMPLSIVNRAKKSPERFVSEWLKDKTFSPDVQELLELGKELVRVSAQHRLNADPKYQLERWDAGFYQIKFGLFGRDVKFTKTPEMIETWEKFNQKYKEVTARLRPYVYELGFLPKEVIYGEVE